MAQRQSASSRFARARSGPRLVLRKPCHVSRIFRSPGRSAFCSAESVARCSRSIGRSTFSPGDEVPVGAPAASGAGVAVFGVVSGSVFPLSGMLATSDAADSAGRDVSAGGADALSVDFGAAEAVVVRLSARGAGVLTAASPPAFEVLACPPFFAIVSALASASLLLMVFVIAGPCLPRPGLVPLFATGALVAVRTCAGASSFVVGAGATLRAADSCAVAGPVDDGAVDAPVAAGVVAGAAGGAAVDGAAGALAAGGEATP